jgi:hypothetical protein
MDSYFIPKIEDLKENYQFEYQEYDEELDIFKDNWIKTNFDSREGLGHDLTYQFQSENVRCEFLTKEQIKAEGWKEIFNRHDGFGKYSYFQKGTTHITFQEKEHLIEIHNDEDYDEHKTWYNGKCRCINEFRAIMKFLEM